MCRLIRLPASKQQLVLAKISTHRKAGGEMWDVGCGVRQRVGDDG